MTDAREGIAATNQEFVSAYGRAAAAGVAALYTEDGQFLAPNSDFITGREAIQATFQSFMDMGVKTVKLETIEVEGYGDTAFEKGRYTLEDESGQVLDNGKLLVIWKNDGGKWKLHRDMINTSMPAPE